MRPAREERTLSPRPLLCRLTPPRTASAQTRRPDNGHPIRRMREGSTRGQRAIRRDREDIGPRCLAPRRAGRAGRVDGEPTGSHGRDRGQEAQEEEEKEEGGFVVATTPSTA